MALRPWSRLRENLLHFIRFAKVSHQSKVTQVFAFYPLQEESFGDLNSQASGVTQPRSPQASAPYKAGTRLHRNMSQRRRNKSSIKKIHWWSTSQDWAFLLNSCWHFSFSSKEYKFQYFPATIHWLTQTATQILLTSLSPSMAKYVTNRNVDTGYNMLTGFRAMAKWCDVTGEWRFVIPMFIPSSQVDPLYLLKSLMPAFCAVSQSECFLASSMNFLEDKLIISVTSEIRTNNTFLWLNLNDLLIAWRPEPVRRMMLPSLPGHDMLKVGAVHQAFKPAYPDIWHLHYKDVSPTVLCHASVSTQTCEVSASFGGFFHAFLTCCRNEGKLGLEYSTLSPQDFERQPRPILLGY